MPAQLLIEPPEPGSACRGIVGLPSDQESLLPRLALAALGRGRSSFPVGPLGHEARALLDVLRSCHLRVDADHEGCVVEGRGLSQWNVPEVALDLRGESHAAALALALLAARSKECEVWVDAAVAETLGSLLQEGGMAQLEALDEKGARVFLPAFASGARPPAFQVVSTGVFAWVKEALLLLALRADGPCQFEERLASADHLERALLRSRVPFTGEGTSWELHPPRDDDALAPQIVEPLGSPDALLALVACMRAWDDGLVGGRNVNLNPTRADVWPVLRAMGLDVQVVPEGDTQHEPKGRVLVGWGDGARPEFRGKIRPGTIAGEVAVRMGDALFSLLAFASDAEGRSVVTDIVPRARGGDGRIVERALGLLRSAGLECESRGGEVLVEGRGVDGRGKRRALQPLTVTTGGDARLALLASALAFRADGQSVIDDVDCLRDSYPRWVGTLRALGARVQVRTVD